MKLASHFGITFIIVVSLSYLKEAKAEDCKTFVRQMLLDQMKFIVPCINKFGLTTPQEKKEKINCIVKCVLIDAKMLAPDGNVDFDLAAKALDSFPDALKEKANGIMSECGHHAAGIDPNEASCQSYSELLTCLIDVSVKFCD